MNVIRYASKQGELDVGLGGTKKLLDFSIPANSGTYDLSTVKGIEDYLKAVYGTTTDKGKKWSKLYEPTIKYIMAQNSAVPSDLNPN